MSTHYDVIVVGAGAMGMSTGYYLSKTNQKVLLIDAFDPPHSNGSHTGDTRIIRHANGEGAHYVPIALRAQELWNELQEQTDDVLFRKTGVVSFGNEESPFVQTALEAAKQYNIPTEVYSGKEMNEKWEGINPPGDFLAVYEPEAGVLHAGACIRAFRRLAIQNGVDLLVNNPVLDYEVNDDSVSVQTKLGTYTADKLVVTAGAWNRPLLEKSGLNIQLQSARRTVGWFKADETLYHSEVFPGFSVDMPEGVFYGFPSIDGEGVKLGEYYTGDDLDPEYINDEFGVYPRDEGDLRGFLEDFMPQAAGKLNAGAVCMFTNTPDEDFIIDFHPRHSNVVLAAGFSGHGFKHSSAVGEILSQLVSDGESKLDISSFSVKRPEVQKE